MNRKYEIEQKSRLGTLLLHKGMISQEQLNRALDVQAKTQEKLGEILIHQGIITHVQLKKALKKQSNYRLVAFIGTAVLAPLQPLMAQASPQEIQQAELAARALTDAELGVHSAQGVTISGEQIIKNLLPISNLLDADIEVEGVTYHDNPIGVNPDHSVNLRLPAKIERIALNNVRIPGSNTPSLGDITISNIEISANLQVSVRPST